MAILRCPSCHRDFEQGFLKCPYDGAALVDAASAESHDPFLGKQLADTYQIVRRLGAGGMGSVYEARHVRLESTFAIKFLRPELSISEEMLARFHREARVAGALKHPNIITVSDVNKTPENLHYIVQEYLDGRPLSALLEEEGTLDIVRGVDIASQVCNALSAAHAKEIVHRDIKPENIFLIDKDGQKDFVKVLDFGIAKMKEAKTQLTRAASVMGTPDYISPEQASSAGEVDFRSDIYSLGVVVYRMFTGRLPYEIENPVIALDAVRVKDPVPPRERRPDLPPSVEAVILRAMTRRPTDRYPSMKDFKDALLGLLTEQELAQVSVPATIRPTPVHLLGSRTPVPATVTGPPRREPTTGPPSPSGGWSKLDVDSLRKTGGVGTPIPAQQMQPTTQSTQHRSPTVAIIAIVAVLAIAGSVAAYYLTRGDGKVGPGSGSVAALGSGTGSATGAATTRADSKPALAARPDSGSGKGPAAGPAGMVLVKGGTFTMGRDDGGKLEKPAHPCTVADFHLAEREVTREEFAAFLGTAAGKAIAEKPEWRNFKPARSDAQLPVVRVTWEEADSYCRAVGRRLPTEAEWEYAARGAGHTSLYPGGELPPDAEHANYTRDKASPAALRPACNPLDGLRDMIGNAGEWTSDLFGYYTKQCGKLKRPPVKGKAEPAPYRVIRGGGFDESDPTHLTATYRIPQEPSAFRWQSVGFRCALTPGKTATP